MASARVWSLLALCMLLASAGLSSADVSAATSIASIPNTYEITSLPKEQACYVKCMCQKRCANVRWLCQPFCSFGCYGGHTPPQTELPSSIGGKVGGGLVPGEKVNLQPILPSQNLDTKEQQPSPPAQNSDPEKQQPSPRPQNSDPEKQQPSPRPQNSDPEKQDKNEAKSQPRDIGRKFSPPPKV